MARIGLVVIAVLAVSLSTGCDGLRSSSARSSVRSAVEAATEDALAAVLRNHMEMSSDLQRPQQTPDEIFERAKAVPMYQWQRFLAVNQALNKYRTFAPAKQAAFAAAQALVAAGCGLKADGGKDPITVVEKVDELLADTVGSTANGASKLLCLPHKHKERANRAKLAVVATIVFAFRIQSAFAFPVGSEKFGYSTVTLNGNTKTSQRDEFVLKLEKLIADLKEMDAAAPEVVALANHIFPSNRTGHAVGMFLDHVMSVMGNAGSVVFSSLMVALPRQSLPACVVQPKALVGGEPFATALQIAAGCDKGADKAGLAKLTDTLSKDRNFQLELLRERYVLALLTEYQFWMSTEREVDPQSFSLDGAKGTAAPKQKYSFIEIDKSKLPGLFQNHWRAVSAIVLGTDAKKSHAPACPCACGSAKPDSFTCPVDVTGTGPAQHKSAKAMKAGGFFSALQPDHPIKASEIGVAA